MQRCYDPRTVAALYFDAYPTLDVRLIAPVNMSAVPSGIDKLVIKLDLSVREGDIGIAGVDESLSTLTTVERFISPGRSIVTLDYRASNARLRLSGWRSTWNFRR